MKTSGPDLMEFRGRVAGRFSGLTGKTDRGFSLGWGRKFLPHYFTQPPSLLHTWLADKLNGFATERGQKIAICGPRESAKSTIGVKTYALHQAVKGLEKYILIISDTAGQAESLLDAIKSEIETNSAIETTYPNAFGAGPVWQNLRIQLNNGVMIQAAGTGTKLRGRSFRQNRPTLILLDDPENDTHIESSTQRDKTRSWVNRTLRNLGTAETNMVILGTALHRDCLTLSAMRTPGYETHRENGRPSPFKSIVEWPVRMDLWDKWESIYLDVDDELYEIKADKFYRKNKKEMNRGAVLLWPEREPIYLLMKMRAEIGRSAFDAEKQGNPIDPSTCEWPEDYFTHDRIWFDEWPEDGLKILALDPSKGKDARRSDYSALVSVLISEKGTVYVDADLERRSTDAITSRAVDTYFNFGADIFAVEINQFQELLAEDIRDEAEAREVHMQIEPLTNQVKKQVRIRRLSSLLKKRRIRFRRGSRGAILCLDQLRDFPNGDHDDGPDGLEMAVRVGFKQLQHAGNDTPEEIIGTLYDEN